MSIFRIYIPNCEKKKSLLKTFTSYNQILTYEEQLFIFSMDSYIWYWLDPNLQCAEPIDAKTLENRPHCHVPLSLKYFRRFCESFTDLQEAEVLLFQVLVNKKGLHHARPNGGLPVLQRWSCKQPQLTIIDYLYGKFFSSMRSSRVVI